MAHTRFTDPELQAIYANLAPAAGSGTESTAEAIAAREGLDLAADLAGVRRRTAASTAPRRRPNRAAGRRDDRRSLESVAFTLLGRRAAHLRPAELRARARAWTRVGLWPHEMDAWIGAVGVDGATIARDCLAVGITLPAMNVIVDGVRVKQRLRGGEPVPAVLARATSCGQTLSA
ncbi:hypothetical protein ABZ864_47900 [Streptomyces sp. NPDC047082]|uniref:hypothetical protein n=1 Tax=Streptomyces sp. NPDC047082 TaxID=3155259 RepID=UPI0033C66E99